MVRDTRIRPLGGLGFDFDTILAAFAPKTQSDVQAIARAAPAIEREIESSKPLVITAASIYLLATVIGTAAAVYGVYLQHKQQQRRPVSRSRKR